MVHKHSIKAGLNLKDVFLLISVYGSKSALIDSFFLEEGGLELEVISSAYFN